LKFSASRKQTDDSIYLWVLKSFFYFLAHIFDKKKSAQIRLKITPIARTTSRVGEIWSQIFFLFFEKLSSGGGWFPVWVLIAER